MADFGWALFFPSRVVRAVQFCDFEPFRPMSADRKGPRKVEKTRTRACVLLYYFSFFVREVYYRRGANASHYPMGIFREAGDLMGFVSTAGNFTGRR